MPLVLGYRNPGTQVSQSIRAGALVTMVVCVQNPLDLCHIRLLKMSGDRRRTGIDQQTVLAACNQVHIASISQTIKVFGNLDQLAVLVQSCPPPVIEYP